MKLSAKTIIATGFALVLSARALFGQGTNPVITIDEFGVGTLNGAPLPSFVGPDPSGGVTTSPVLIYTLPFAVNFGDLVLVSSNEPPNSPSWPISDVVRFWFVGNTNQGAIIFYSDVTPNDPPDAPADSGLPQFLLGFSTTVNETGPESGPNGAIYTTAPGLPGVIPALGTVQYRIISDVPEPGPAALVLTGLASLFAVNRYNRRRSYRNCG